MDKRTYVKRLKKMIANKNDACFWCPCSKNFDATLPSTLFDCEICQSFAGLKYKSPTFEGGCPCKRPGKLGAVARALKKIEEYEDKNGEV